VYSSDMRKRFATSSRTFDVGGAVPPQAEAEKAPPPAPADKEGPGRSAAALNMLGVGIYGNTFNPAGGVTALWWPWQHVGLQASYTLGTFTTAEARLLARFGQVMGVKPYIGIGYLSVTKDETVIGIDTKFKDSSISGVLGAEVPLGRRWFGYAEVMGTSIDLEEIVTNGGQTVKASYDYAPVTIGVGIVYFFF
jgi:Outer membrane protein beta-barrel domain